MYPKPVVVYAIVIFLLIQASVGGKEYEPPNLKLDSTLSHVTDENGQPLTPNLYHVNLSKALRRQLLSMIEKNGILDRFRAIEKAPLNEGTSVFEQFDNLQWHIQRPTGKWQSNMHWISPAEENSQQAFLMALGDGGLDETLQTIGIELGMDNIVCFQLTFIGITNCMEGFMHYDFRDTHAKAFNLIIPILLVKNSSAELDVQADSGKKYGIKYEYEKGVMIGDEAYHASSAIDYSDREEMRIMATVYLADVNEDNVDGILAHYTQAYPPSDRDWLFEQRGRHWSRRVPLSKLPTKHSVEERVVKSDLEVVS